MSEFETTGNTHVADVTILGCGLMGSALARAFADADFTVGVWNRTPQRAQALAAHPNLTAIATLEQATRSAPVVVLSLGTYADVEEVLNTSIPLSGTTLVNLTTGTPSEAEQLAAWAERHHVAYLDGAILAYPQHIGTAESLILLAGSAEAFTVHASMLGALGEGVRYLSGSVADANTLDTSIVGAFYISTLVALAESTAYAAQKGVGPTELKRCIRHVLGLLESVGEELVNGIIDGDHVTDQATLGVYCSAASSFSRAMAEDGMHARLIGAAVSALDGAVQAGHADSALSAVALTAQSTRSVTTR